MHCLHLSMDQLGWISQTRPPKHNLLCRPHHPNRALRRVPQLLPTVVSKHLHKCSLHLFPILRHKEQWVWVIIPSVLPSHCLWRGTLSHQVPFPSLKQSEGRFSETVDSTSHIKGTWLVDPRSLPAVWCGMAVECCLSHNQ